MSHSFKQVLQQHLLEEHYGAVIKALTTLADQMGDNRLMNNAVLYYQRLQQLQQLEAKGAPYPDAHRQLKEQIRQGLWQLIEQAAS